jgi:hypothetical protein
MTKNVSISQLRGAQKKKFLKFIDEKTYLVRQEREIHKRNASRCSTELERIEAVRRGHLPLHCLITRRKK